MRARRIRQGSAAAVARRPSALEVIRQLTETVSRATALDDILEEALNGLLRGLGADRAAVLLFDPGGVMRFRAWRGLSDGYRGAVEGHSPWPPGVLDPRPIVIASVPENSFLGPLAATVLAEGIQSLAFIPLVCRERLLGKFMLYYDRPHEITAEEMLLAETIAGHVAFAVDRRAAEDALTLYREIFVRANDGIAVVDTEGRYLEQNPAHRELIGYSDEELRSRTPAVHLGEESFARIATELAATGRHRGEYVSRTKSGADVPVEISAFSVCDDEGRPVCFVGFKREITERRHAEAERARLLEREQEARRSAEQANRLKDEFLATLSHELRTPLNSMLGWARLLKMGQLEPASFERGLSAVERAAVSQTEIINDLLDVSRIVSGKLRLEVQPLDLAGVLEAAIDAARPAAGARRLELAAERAPGPIPVVGDAARLQQVFGNLLSNAIKFTERGGRITIGLRSERGRAAVSISDTGRGIAPEFLPHVFERFRQADGSSTRMHGGLGLGLAIVRHIVEAHGGSVEAGSPGAGRGATFTVSLPLAGEDALSTARGTQSDRSATKRKPARALEGLRVLVVDDDADARHLLSVVVEQFGGEVHTAASAAEALAELDVRRPDVLVSDISMPARDGYSLVAAIRESEGAPWQRVPAIALTAYAGQEARQRALSAGFDMHVAKPVDPNELARAVSSLARRKEHNAQSGSE